MKDTKELVSLVFSFVRACCISLEDGDITFSDLKNFPQVLPKLWPAIDGITDIPKEISNPSKEEILDLCEHIKSEFDLKNDNLETLIINIIDIIFSLIISIQEYRKSHG